MLNDMSHGLLNYKFIENSFQHSVTKINGITYKAYIIQNTHNRNQTTKKIMKKEKKIIMIINTIEIEM
ncbi:unnamed protein product [Schistosoma margrebowiei]|uniref:Uncharacterized protein n=1 Tax=Schistosoma margrebowiei TaxID=48269 RepID=A0AA84ZLA3_9TREM|nr:unnamed protein product [Schistosoma margrebowiei]